MLATIIITITSENDENLNIFSKTEAYIFALEHFIN